MVMRLRADKATPASTSKKETVDNVNGFEKPTGNSRLYIEERLQRDHPEIWQERCPVGNGSRARKAWS
jgi:hypothetical protein